MQKKKKLSLIGTLHKRYVPLNANNPVRKQLRRFLEDVHIGTQRLAVNTGSVRVKVVKLQWQNNPTPEPPITYKNSVYTD